MVITKNENSTPNKKYYYSSMNYILLGIIIEEISQQDIISFLKQNIFDPLNMMNTGYEEYDFSVVDLIPGECILDADKYENYQMNYSSLMYSGGLYSTIDDLRKWCLEFSNPTVLPKWYIKNPKGWINEKKYNRDVQYHFGNLPAYSALVMIIKDSSNSFYIVLSNQGNNRMNPSIRKLPEFIFTKKT
jgi:CubicO group peptidase (beta-lactamase class C family)